MPLKGVCPDCGLAADLHAFAGAAEQSQALAAALDMPAGLGSRVTAYLRLFSPPKRALSAHKAARLLTELAEAVNSGQVERKGESFAAPLETWKAGLDQMLTNRQTLRLPLKSHGYLCEIVAGLAQKAEAKAEAARIERERHRPRDAPQGAAAPAGEKASERRGWRPTDALIEAQLKRMREAAGTPPNIPAEAGSNDEQEA